MQPHWKSKGLYIYRRGGRDRSERYQPKPPRCGPQPPPRQVTKYGNAAHINCAPAHGGSPSRHKAGRAPPGL